jgi:uncharacterized RDD family membrane protein YckC
VGAAKGGARVLQTSNQQKSLRPAVWFFPSDYAGFWRRLAIALADSAVIAVVLLVATTTVVLLDPAEELSDALLAWLIPGWLLLIYGYFVVLKCSRFTTVGYRLAGVRIVDSLGRRPGLSALTLRLSFGLIGPLNVILDALWIPFDRHKQALRDKFANTYVVKATAEPAGPARIVFRTYDVMGMSFVFQDVEPVAMGGPGR